MTSQLIPCLICGDPLTVRAARGRKSGKPFIMLLCGQDGRHFRAFINDRGYVDNVLAQMEGHTPSEEPAADREDCTTHYRRSKTDLERDS